MSLEPVALAGSICLVASASLLAQITPEAIMGWEKLGALGFMGVVLVWIVTKTLPGMTKQHSDSLEKIVERFDKQLTAQRVHDDKQGDEQEKRASQRHADLMQAIKEMK